MTTHKLPPLPAPYSEKAALGGSHCAQYNKSNMESFGDDCYEAGFQQGMLRKREHMKTDVPLPEPLIRVPDFCGNTEKCYTATQMLAYGAACAAAAHKKCESLQAKIDVPLPEYPVSGGYWTEREIGAIRCYGAACAAAALEAKPAAVPELTEEQRIHLAQAAEMLEDWQHECDIRGNDSIAKGAEASAYVLRQMLAASKGNT